MVFGKPHRRKFEGGVDVVINFTGGDTGCRRSGDGAAARFTCGATAGFDPKEDLRYIWTFRQLGSNSGRSKISKP